jgi:prevent-host-death family protein
MRNLRTISSTDLAAHTRDVVHQVRQGQPAIVRSAGEDQVVLLDALDYRLLQGVAGWAIRPAMPSDSPTEEQVVRAYLDEEVSLGRAAELLGISRFDLQARFQRLEIPLRQGPANEDEAFEEIEVAQDLNARAS